MVDQVSLLLVDDDQAMREVAQQVFRQHGFHVDVASSGEEAIRLAARRAFDLVVLDFRLPDMTAIDLVTRLKHQFEPLKFIAVSGFLTVETTVRLMRLGALDVIEKPLDLDTLAKKISDAVHRARGNGDGRKTGPVWNAGAARSVAKRWATYVWNVCESPGDPKTLTYWARFVGVSNSSLSEICRVLDMRPHDARDLARVLRAVIQSNLFKCPPEVFLDVADRRTLKILFERAGIESGLRSFLSIDDYLQQQQFIAADNAGIVALRVLATQHATTANARR
jgi:CheY-like chemotaxis protein